MLPPGHPRHGVLQGGERRVGVLPALEVVDADPVCGVAAVVHVAVVVVGVVVGAEGVERLVRLGEASADRTDGSHFDFLARFIHLSGLFLKFFWGGFFFAGGAVAFFFGNFLCGSFFVGRVRERERERMSHDLS